MKIEQRLSIMVQEIEFRQFRKQKLKKKQLYAIVAIYKGFNSIVFGFTFIPQPSVKQILAKNRSRNCEKKITLLIFPFI